MPKEQYPRLSSSLHIRAQLHTHTHPVHLSILRQNPYNHLSTCRKYIHKKFLSKLEQQQNKSNFQLQNPVSGILTSEEMNTIPPKTTN